MKNIKQIRNQIKRLHRNNRGIETRVLIYILAAIALIAAIAVVTQVNNQASTMTSKALIQAEVAAPGDTLTKAQCTKLGYTCSSEATCKAGCCTATYDFTVNPAKYKSCAWAVT